MNSQISPNEKSLALTYKSVTKASMKDSLAWAQENWDSYNDYIVNGTKYRRPLETNKRYIYQEFLFKGFVHIEDFSPKKKFSYITSNQRICGHMMIFPKHFSTEYKYQKKGYENPYYAMSKIGIAGFTRIQERLRNV